MCKVRRFSKLRLIILLGLLFLWACASDRESQRLPKLSAKEPGFLIPASCFYPAGIKGNEGRYDDPGAVDPELAREIEKFLLANHMFNIFDSPLSRQIDLPMIINTRVAGYLRHFTGRQKGVFQIYLARSGRYLPMMQRIFKDQGLPSDLAYLALIESGFSPWAVSVAQAVGPWQFIRETAARYGLKVNAWVDERRDPEKATRAAARYLKDLYRQFGSWYLAAAAYNAGEGRVQGAINRHDTEDFWQMAQERLLPQETCNYVPQLIAAVLISKSPQKYGLEPINYQLPLSYTTMRVPAGTDLKWVAEVLEISFAGLKELNPELSHNQAPRDQTVYVLKIPVGKRQKINHLADILSKF
ncbi:MAG: lytic transglycosylase domain-containing protein [Desulfobacca sp.]|nr:lytic transglycosylase domain-containing protein [Desulfobacca sp.]